MPKKLSKKDINKIYCGIIVRIIVTLILLNILSMYFKNDNNKYLILPIVIYVLDNIDNLCTFKDKYLCHNRIYSLLDKFMDIITYFYVYYLFNLDNIFLFIILYRLIGTFLYFLTLNGFWLIIFVDLSMEYLLYKYIFNNNYIYTPIVIIVKVYLEYYWYIKKNIK